jgi:hypothetical protein
VENPKYSHALKDDKGFYIAPVGLGPEQMAGTGLPWQEVLALLQAARQKVKAVWVLAHCCRAAPGPSRERQAMGQDLRRGVEEGGNLIIATASVEDQPSYEWLIGLAAQRGPPRVRGGPPRSPAWLSYAGN